MLSKGHLQSEAEIQLVYSKRMKTMENGIKNSVKAIENASPRRSRRLMGRSGGHFGPQGRSRGVPVTSGDEEESKTDLATPPPKPPLGRPSSKSLSVS